MTKLKLLIAVLFAVALGTGILVGMGVSRAPKHHERGSWLVHELNLTPAQSEKMRAIWSAVPRRGQSFFEQRRQFQQERDDAVQALLSAGQKAQYGKIMAKYDQQLGQLRQQREEAFQAAVQSTKAILTDAQRTKYDELLKRGFRGRREHEGGRHGPPTHRGAAQSPGGAPTSAPGRTGVRGPA